MFSLSSPFSVSKRDETGAFLVDRDPVYFRHVLNFLRTGELVLDDHVSADGLLCEAEFFQIEQMIDLLQPHNRPDICRKDVMMRIGTPGLSFSRFRLVGIDLSGLNLAGIPFVKSLIRGTQFAKSVLKQSTLNRAVGDRANFGGANMTMAKMQMSYCTRSNFTGLKAPNANFCGSNFSGSDFSNAQLQGALFQRACLRGCSFRGANLEHAKFQEADLREADLTDAILDECHLTDADLRNARVDLVFKLRQVGVARVYTKGAILTKEQHTAIPEDRRAKLEFTTFSTVPEGHPFLKRIAEDVKNSCVVYIKGNQQEAMGDRLHKRLFSVIESLKVPVVCRNAFDDATFDPVLTQFVQCSFLPKVFINGRFVNAFSDRSAIRASKRELRVIVEAALADPSQPPNAVPQTLPFHVTSAPIIPATATPIVSAPVSASGSPVTVPAPAPAPAPALAASSAVAPASAPVVGNAAPK